MRQSVGVFSVKQTDENIPPWKNIFRWATTANLSFSQSKIDFSNNVPEFLHGPANGRIIRSFLLSSLPTTLPFVEINNVNQHVQQQQQEGKNMKTKARFSF